MIADLKKVLSLFHRQEKWRLAMLFVMMVAAAFLEAVGVGAIPLFVAFVMRPASLSESELVGQWLPDLPVVPTVDLVLWASAILLGFVVFKNLFLGVVFYIQARIVTRQQARLADRMFRAYQSAPYDWLLQRSTSELQRNIQQDTAAVLSGVVMPLLDLSMALIMSVGIMLVMLAATPSSTLLAMLVVVLGLFAVIRVFQRQLRVAGEISRSEGRESINAIQQGFGALVDARIIGCERFLASAHKRSVFRSANATVRANIINKVTPYAIETLAIVGLLIILLFMVHAQTSLAESLPMLSVIGIGVIRLKQIAAKVAGSVNRINQSRPYIPGLISDLDELVALERRSRADVSGERLIDRFDTLELSEVHYRYPKSDMPAIDGVSLTLRKGESIALVGPTGCGKSTLVNLILGLLTPQSGSIRVNGIEIRSDPNGWRDCLGYIPQTIFLVDDTLRANIAFGVESDQVDESQIRKALNSAALADFIDALPEGLDTMIGERGVRLSGGQRQRLGIARALYFNPEVLVMDEATSALDNRTEVEVMQAISNLKKERTLIMIAHRLSTVEDCDRLYHLDAGRIVASGSYRELVEESADFRQMAAVAG